MTTIQDVALMMTSVRAVDLMTTARVAVAAASTTVPAAASTTRKNLAVAAKVTSARKTRCMTARKPLAKSA
jgi:hypothetical protein